MRLHLSILVCVLTTLLSPGVGAAGQDRACVQSCSDWSVTLGYCHAVFGSGALCFCRLGCQVWVCRVEPYILRLEISPQPLRRQLPHILYDSLLSDQHNDVRLPPSIHRLTPTASHPNQTVADQSLSCLCTGSIRNSSIGNAAIQASAGICQDCTTTPERVKEDLSVCLPCRLVRLSC
jgi:hypothetical protein